MEDQLAFLERLPALLLLPGDGSLGDVTVLEPVGQRLQPLVASGVADVRLAVFTDDDTTGTVDGLVEVHREALVLVVLTGKAVRASSRSRPPWILSQAAFISSKVSAASGRTCRAGLCGSRAGRRRRCRVGVQLVEVGRGVNRGRQEARRSGTGRLAAPRRICLAANSAVQTTSTLSTAILRVLDLRVLDHLLALLVGVVGQLVDRDLAVRVSVVELLDQLREVPDDVLAVPDLDVTLLGEISSRRPTMPPPLGAPPPPPQAAATKRALMDAGRDERPGAQDERKSYMPHFVVERTPIRWCHLAHPRGNLTEKRYFSHVTLDSL